MCITTKSHRHYTANITLFSTVFSNFVVIQKLYFSWRLDTFRHYLCYYYLICAVKNFGKMYIYFSNFKLLYIQNIVYTAKLSKCEQLRREEKNRRRLYLCIGINKQIILLYLYTSATSVTPLRYTLRVHNIWYKVHK